MAPEVETVPSSYDLKSEAWAFGKTILEIARWSSVSRLRLLMGHDRPAEYGGPYGIEAAMVRLTENDPASRSTVADAMSDFQPYFELALLPASIPEENFEKVRTDIGELKLTADGPTGKWTRNIDKNEMIALVDSIARNPEQHFRIREKCPTCGSPLTVLLAIYDDTPWDDTYHAAFLLGCFGYQDRSCGVHHGAWD